MPTLSVHLHAPDGSAVAGVLSTDHAASSYGWPVLLVVEAGRLLASRPLGYRDATPIGLAFTLWVEPAEEPSDEQRKILDRWRDACATCRAQLGYEDPEPPRDEETADPPGLAVLDDVEEVGSVLLPDDRLLVVQRGTEPGRRGALVVRLRLPPSQSPEGVDLSVKAALELLRTLDRALRFPALEDTERDR